MAQLSAELSGYEVHADSWLESRSKRQHLLDLTEQLAEKLRAGGLEPKRKGAAPVVVVGVCSGKVEVVEQWRNINFLPAVAAANRSQVLRRMNFFSEAHSFLRYGVVTRGSRCSLADLRGRISELSRSISKFAALPELKGWGIEVQLRATEFTVRRERGGELSFHPHANLVFECTRRLRPEEWQAFLRLARERFPGHWKDCGRVVDAAEVVKYCTKPVELLELEPSELVALARAIHGLKLVQPMGAFADLGRDLEERGVKLAKRLEKGVWRWCEVRKAGREGKASEEPTASSNAVLAVLPPQPRFLPRLEPCLLVMNYTGDLSAAVREAKLEEMLVPAMEKWLAAISSTPTRQLSQPAQTSCSGRAHLCSAFVGGAEVPPERRGLGRRAPQLEPC